MATNKKSQDLSLKEYDGNKTKTTILKPKRIRGTEWIIIDLFSKNNNKNQKCANAKSNGDYIFAITNLYNYPVDKSLLNVTVYNKTIPTKSRINRFSINYETNDRFDNLSLNDYRKLAAALKQINLRFNKKKGVFIYYE